MKRIIPIVAGLIFISLLFFPPIRIVSGFPSFQFIDLFLPILAVLVFLKRKEFKEKKLAVLILSFAVYIFLTILINGRIGFHRDYFEVLKMIKLLIVFLLFSTIELSSFVKKWIKPAFIFLVIINLLHYYNAFYINDYLDIYHSGGRYSMFGLNTAGELSYKRMIGLIGNPNDNAILFLMFAVLFIPKRKSKINHYLWFGTAIIMMFLCQSRTAMISLIIMIIVYSIYSYHNFKSIIFVASTSAMSFIISYGITKTSIDIGNPSRGMKDSALHNIDENHDESTYLGTLVGGDLNESESYQGRIRIWRQLWEMIEKKPIFGHAPYKEYFYDRHLYAESEYILLLWRYGFIGLGIYLTIMGALTIIAIKNRRSESSVALLLLLTLLIITGITNVPFEHKTLSVLFGLMCGMLIKDIRQVQNNLTTENKGLDEED